MAKRIKPLAVDWMKLGGLLLMILIVGVDIVMVRGKNRLLWNNLALQKTESAKTLKMVEIKANEEIARANQRVRDAIERLAEEKGKFKDAESEWSDRMREVQLANQKEVAELKASYENRIQEMKDDFDKRLNDTRFSARRMPQNYSQDSNMVRCRGCAGKGFITEKRSCQHCGGSGKIRTTSEGLRKGGYNRSTRVSVSTVFEDCPYCQPGAMKGGGSKGYTIERQTCPNCDGSGMMSK